MTLTLAGHVGALVLIVTLSWYVLPNIAGLLSRRYGNDDLQIKPLKWRDGYDKADESLQAKAAVRRELVERLHRQSLNVASGGR